MFRRELLSSLRELQSIFVDFGKSLFAKIDELRKVEKAVGGVPSKLPPLDLPEFKK